MIYEVKHLGKTIEFTSNHKEASNAYLPLRRGVELWTIDDRGNRRLVEGVSQISHNAHGQKGGANANPAK